MSSTGKVKGKKLLAHKKRLQRDFLDKSKAEGLSSVQTVERASIFPKDDKPRVVKWPKF